jgi:hypothetical protein
VQLLVQFDYAVAAVVPARYSYDFWHDVDEERVEGAQARAVRDDMVCELLQLGLGCAGEDEGREDGLEAVGVGRGEARVDEGRLKGDWRAVEGGRDGLEGGVVAWVAERGRGVDRGRDLGGRESVRHLLRSLRAS